jgi:D-galactarolactone cycloisomerase
MLIEYDTGENPLRDEIVVEPIRLSRGLLKLPDRPGLGVELDPVAMKRYRLDG